MKTFFSAIGIVVLMFWLLGVLGFLDFYLCVGALNSCTPPIPSIPTYQGKTI